LIDSIDIIVLDHVILSAQASSDKQMSRIRAAVEQEVAFTGGVFQNSVPGKVFCGSELNPQSTGFASVSQDWFASPNAGENVSATIYICRYVLLHLNDRIGKSEKI